MSFDTKCWSSIGGLCCGHAASRSRKNCRLSVRRLLLPAVRTAGVSVLRAVRRATRRARGLHARPRVSLLVGTVLVDLVYAPLLSFYIKDPAIALRLDHHLGIVRARLWRNGFFCAARCHRRVCETPPRLDADQRRGRARRRRRTVCGGGVRPSAADRAARVSARAVVSAVLVSVRRQVFVRAGAVDPVP